MPEYLAPGVYVEEVPSAVKPIAGVSTSTAGFIAVVPDSVQLPGPIKGSGSPPKFASVAVTPAAANEVKLVTSWSDFVKYFGDLIGGGLPGTAFAVQTAGEHDGVPDGPPGVHQVLYHIDDRPRDHRGAAPTEIH